MKMKDKITAGKTFLGIELGSTRIKAVLLDDTYATIATGGYSWENRYENGYWTYDMEDVYTGLRECYAALAADVQTKYSVPLTTIGAMGISGMMHGYLVYDKDDNLLTPFRTWRNTTTAQAADILRDLFHFNIPQRWSIAHLYQAMLNGEEHVPQIARLTTLATQIHYLLTGRHETGMCEASGMFPLLDGQYDESMLQKFDTLAESYPWNIRDLLPAARPAGFRGAYLTEAGAKFLDPTGTLQAGIPVCPPEGDGGTGMTATNAVLPGTGNVSAGTSVFSMLVLDKPLKGVYPEIDICTTPDGSPTAMVHSNNGCSELDAWVNIFREFAELSGHPMDISDIYSMLYHHAMSGDKDCGEVISYNLLAGEPVAGVEKGFPMIFRTPDSKMNLANMMQSQLYAAVTALKLGMDLLVESEGIHTAHFMAHGGLFKVKGAAQQILANSLNTPVSTVATAGEGGAWGMALLAAYMGTGSGKSLGQWLETEIFAGQDSLYLEPDPAGVAGYEAYMKQYKAGIAGVNGLKEVQVCWNN
ncbi:MAG: ATPase [Clostridia bacterium]|nr:ATPase [Clostridia bacterium]